MTLMVVRDYLQSVLPVEGIWFGVAKMDLRKSVALCLYGTPVRMEAGMKIGGVCCTGYRQKRMMLALRGGTNAAEAERLAFAVHRKLTRQRVVLDGTTGFMRAMDSEPYALGTDPFGVWEYRMDFEMYYEVFEASEGEVLE